VGYQSNEPLPQNIANLLLGINHRSHLGAWQLMESDGSYFALGTVEELMEDEEDFE